MTKLTVASIFAGGSVCSSFCADGEPCSITADGKCDVQQSLEGFNFIGVESDQHHSKIAEVKKVQQLDLFDKNYE